MADAGALTLSRLLHAWRVDVAGLQASRVAAELGLGRSALSNWESGRRRPDEAVLKRLDGIYHAGGVLVGLAEVIGTPAGLDARKLWWNNFAADSGPVWAWIRPDKPGPLGALIVWGPLGARLGRNCDGRGLIVTLPVSVSNPPVRVELDDPGWVDFGQGRPPDRIGIPVVAALSHIRLVATQDHTVVTFADALQALLGHRDSWLGLLTRFIGTRPDLVIDAFGQPGPGSQVSDLTGGDPPPAPGVHEPLWPGWRYQALRHARSLSQPAAAARATALLPESPVTDDQISLLEGGGLPKVAALASRLDVVYRADGHTIVEPVPTTKAAGRTPISFPDYWTGPIWVTFTSTTTAPGEVALLWPPWERRLRLRPGTAVTARQAPGNLSPLVVQTPPGWEVAAGIGAHPDAIDVNDGWHATDRPAARQIFNQYYETYLHLFGKTRQDLVRLLRQTTELPPPPDHPQPPHWS